MPTPGSGTRLIAGILGAARRSRSGTSGCFPTSAGPTETSRLADHLNIAPSTLSEHLADLEARGLVARARSEPDRRRVEVRRTPLAESQLTANGPLTWEVLERAVQRLGDDAEAVVVALERLADAVEAR